MLVLFRHRCSLFLPASDRLVSDGTLVESGVDLEARKDNDAHLCHASSFYTLDTCIRCFYHLSFLARTGELGEESNATAHRPFMNGGGVFGKDGGMRDGELGLSVGGERGRRL